MMETFLATLSPMLVMFLYIALGYIANKLKLVPENTATVLSKLENYFFVPALIINTFMKYCTVDSVMKNSNLILYSTAILAVAMTISIFFARFFSTQDYRRNIYKYALTFGNFSFMGNAIVPVILGELALYKYMLYILPLNIAVYTWGLIILIPKNGEKKSVLQSLLNPIFVSILIGAFLGLTGIKDYVPQFLTTTLTNCAACMAPLAMILTGFVIGSYSFKKLITKKRIYIATLLRLIILPSLFLGLLVLFGTDKEILFLTLFAFATPLGLNTVVFPAAYGGDASTGASMAMISHTFCIITIPIMYAIIDLLP